MMNGIGLMAVWLILRLASAAVGSPLHLTCDNKQLSNGSFVFQLSQPPSSHNCSRCWEDGNKMVIARDSESLPGIVLGLTDESITLAHCQALHYIVECDGLRVETDCTCHSDQNPSPSHSITPRHHRHIGLAVAGILLIGLIIVCLYFWKKQSSAKKASGFAHIHSQV
ncbi:uncharacterized protein KZ484_012108 isoform 2-T2 [Pholidichthys leucotaenia]